jgi:hypothetical protein
VLSNLDEVDDRDGDRYVSVMNRHFWVEAPDVRLAFEMLMFVARGLRDCSSEEGVQKLSTFQSTWILDFRQIDELVE